MFVFLEKKKYHFCHSPVCFFVLPANIQQLFTLISPFILNLWKKTTSYRPLTRLIWQKTDSNLSNFFGTQTPLEKKSLHFMSCWVRRTFMKFVKRCLGQRCYYMGFLLILQMFYMNIFLHWSKNCHVLLLLWCTACLFAHGAREGDPIASGCLRHMLIPGLNWCTESWTLVIRRRDRWPDFPHRLHFIMISWAAMTLGWKSSLPFGLYASCVIQVAMSVWWCHKRREEVVI